MTSSITSSGVISVSTFAVPCTRLRQYNLQCFADRSCRNYEGRSGFPLGWGALNSSSTTEGLGGGIFRNATLEEMFLHNESHIIRCQVGVVHSFRVHHDFGTLVTAANPEVSSTWTSSISPLATSSSCRASNTSYAPLLRHSGSMHTSTCERLKLHNSALSLVIVGKSHPLTWG
jgi:hypothetical protein